MTILISLGLIAVYLVDVFRNPDLVDKQDKRILWVVLIIAVGPFTMPVLVALPSPRQRIV